MDYTIQPYTFIFIIACVIDLFALGLVLYKSRFSGKAWLIIEVVAILFWNFCLIFSNSAVNFETEQFWAKLAYLGANTVSPVLLIFFLHYPLAKFHISKRWKALLFALPVLTILSVLTNDLHHLYWTGFTLLSSETNAWQYHHGVIFWVALAYNYLCGVACIFLMASILRDYKGIYHSQALTLLIFSVFPFFSGLIYSFAPSFLPGLDHLPLAYTIAGVGVVISVVFFRMLDIVPIGRNLIIDTMQVGMMVVDERQRIVDINPAARKLFVERGLKIGDNVEKAGPSVAEHLNKGLSNSDLEIASERTRYVDLSTTVLKTQSGAPIGKMGIFRDITEYHFLRKQLQELATHDPLTGLANRRLLLERIDFAISEAKRHHQNFALLSLDLDRFKEVNDTYGHALGDKVLIEMGHRVAHCLREIDTVSRVGGDEFSVLVREVKDKTALLVVVRKILTELRKPVRVDDVAEMRMSGSIGGALYPQDGTDPLDLLNKSDLAMYAVKSSGRDNYKLFSEN